MMIISYKSNGDDKGTKMNHKYHAMLLAALFLTLPLGWFEVLADQWDIRSETIITGYERQDDTETDNLLIPAYQYLTIDYGRPLDSGLTCHAQGWGRYDLSGNDFFDTPGDGELLYGYIGYHFSPEGADVKLGRQRVVSGYMGTVIDGVSLRTPILKWFTLSGYGGIPAFSNSETTLKDRKIFGSRLGLSMGNTDLGISCRINRNTLPDDDEKLGIDVSAILPGDIVFSGYSAMNTVSGAWAEHAYEARIPLRNMEITPMLQQINYSDLFGDGSRKTNAFRFFGETDDRLTVAGGNASIWQGQLEIGIQLKHYSFDKQPESSLYTATFLNWNAWDKALADFEFGRMGSDSPENRFILGRSGIKTGSIPFVSEKNKAFIDLLYVHYTASIYHRNNEYSAVAGCSRRFLKDLLVMVVSGEFSRNPYFDQDFKATVIVMYDGGAGVEVRP